MRILLDSNILFSAILFGGAPQKILEFVSEDRILASTSPPLIEELMEVLRRKSSLTNEQLLAIKSSVENMFTVVSPRKEIKICRDPDDNRVLEAAVEGNCDFIVTGDKDLLALKKYKHIIIVTPSELLSRISN